MTTRLQRVLVRFSCAASDVEAFIPLITTSMTRSSSSQMDSEEEQKDMGGPREICPVVGSISPAKGEE